MHMHAHSCKSASPNGFGKILFYFDKNFFDHVSGLGKLPEEWKFERVGSRPSLFIGSVQDTSPHFQDLIILSILTNQNIHVYEKNSLNFSFLQSLAQRLYQWAAVILCIRISREPSGEIS